jgi:hypothetical protein
MQHTIAPLAFAIVVLGLTGACSREPAPQTAQPASQSAAQPAPATPANAPADQPAATPVPAGSQDPSSAAHDLADTAAAGQPATQAPAAAREAPDAAPTQPPAPRYREVTIPDGSVLRVSLRTPVASDTSAIEDPVTADLQSPVVVDGRTVLPAGTDLHGNVTSVARSGKVKGRAQLSVRFSSLVLHGERLAIRTASIAREAQGTKKKDTAKIGIPAAGGALLGGIIGGKKGAAIGAGVGGGAGTAAVLSTRGEEVRLAAGTSLSVRLTEPLTVRIRVD